MMLYQMPRNLLPTLLVPPLFFSSPATILVLEAIVTFIGCRLARCIKANVTKQGTQSFGHERVYAQGAVKYIVHFQDV